MKRILIFAMSLLVGFGMMASQSIAQEETYTIGIVTFAYEDGAFPTDMLIRNLENDLDGFPPDPGTNQGTNRPPLSGAKWLVEVKEADTVGEQIAAIEAFVEAGVYGIMVVPAADNPALRTAVESTVSQGTPVYVLWRPLPGIVGANYVGLAYEELGHGFTAGAMSGGEVGTIYATIVSDMADPRQALFAAGTEARLPNSTHVMTLATAYDDVVTLLNTAVGDEGEIENLIVTDPALFPEISRAIFDTLSETDRLVQVATIGGFANRREAFSNREIAFIFTQEHYSMFWEAAVQFKLNWKEDRPYEDFFMLGQGWGTRGISYLPYPYVDSGQGRFVWSGYW
jgi:hypothetical protein